MDLFFEKYTRFIDASVNVMGALCRANHAFTWFIQERARQVFALILEGYSSVACLIYGPFRWTTIPLNLIIVRTWLWYIFRGDEREPLDATGVHFIQAKPGGGKSMLAFQKANEIADRTGYASYMTSAIEKPRISRNNLFKVVTHKVINIRSYYREGSKVKQYNTKKRKSLFVDEFHYLNNPRLNKTRDYNGFFVPFQSDLILMRHQGFDNNVYLFSQLPTNDIQIMSIVVFYHEIELKLGVSYWRWLKTGKFQVLPLKWKIKTYSVDLVKNNRKKLYRKWKKKVDQDRLQYFNTFAMKNEFAHLPLDYK